MEYFLLDNFPAMWKRVISFIFFGCLATVLNVGLYYLFRFVGISVQVSTIFAWFFCVLFAYFTNKRYVFAAQGSNFVREILLFYSSRVFSGILDVLVMSLLVDTFHFNEIVSKIADEILVSAFNFAFSFLVIFKNKKKENREKNTE